jgi:hypothetical protein
MINADIVSLQNISLSFVAYILFYLEETKFTLPLEDIMVSITSNEYIVDN